MRDICETGAVMAIGIDGAHGVEKHLEVTSKGMQPTVPEPAQPSGDGQKVDEPPEPRGRVSEPDSELLQYFLSRC